MDYEIVHKDGVSWVDAPDPPKRHKHWPQTYGWSGLDYIERCPCGAFGDGRGGWMLLDEPRVARSYIQKLLGRA